MALQRAIFLGLLCLLVSCQAFYLPGVAPQDYAKVWLLYAAACYCGMLFAALRVGVQGDKLTLKVNKLSSTKTQLPYDYYSIPYCRPESIVSSAENLGEVLRGDRIENSLYEVCTCLICQPRQCGSYLRLSITVLATCRSRSGWTSSARYCAEWILCLRYRQRHLPPKLKMSTGSTCKPEF